MNARDRVVYSLNHLEADHIAIDFGGTPSSGIHIDAYSELLHYINRNTEPKIIDIYQFLAKQDVDIMKQFHADIYLLHRMKPRFGISIKQYKEYITPHNTTCMVPVDFNPVKMENGDYVLMQNGIPVARMPSDGYYFDTCCSDHQFVETFEDVDRVRFEVFSEEELCYLQAEAKRVYEQTDFAIVGAFGGSILESTERAMGFEKTLMDMLTNKEVIYRYFEKLAQAHLENLSRYLEAVGDYIQVIQFSDDLGSQNSLLLSAATYREMIWPFHKALYTYVKEHYPHIKVLLHSCGAISPLLDDLIDAGVDAINPVQISASGMNPEELKRNYGDALTFWGGGADLQGICTSGDIGKIREHVQRNIEIFRKNGGFVFAPVHNIQPNITPEVVKVIYDTAWECR